MPDSQAERCTMLDCDRGPSHDGRHLQRSWDHRDPNQDTWTQLRGEGGRFIAFEPRLDEGEAAYREHLYT